MPRTADFRIRPEHRRGRAGRPPGGFTIVELLVIIGIIGLLIGLLVPALSGVKRRVAKATEVDSVRQVGVAWAMYANQSNDYVLPGYLASEAQQAWAVTYRFPDGSKVLPAPDYVDYGDFSDGIPNHAGPWPWRLMPYLDYSEEVVLGYRDGPEADAISLEARAETIANRPAFAYNALFVGGWWTDQRTYLYERARVVDSEARVAPVSRSLGGIRRPSELVTYGSAAERGVGVFKYERTRDDRLDGAHTMMPPILTTYEVWGPTKVRHEGGGGSGAVLTARTGGDLYSLERYGNDDWFEDPVPFG